MAEPLTNIQEPGFFSRVQESPSLFLTPGSVQVVGLIGEGKPTKTLSDSLTRSAETADELSAAAVSISLASSNAIYRYPASSYELAVKSKDLSTPPDLSAKTLQITVDGQSQEVITFSAGTDTIGEMVTDINAQAAQVEAEESGDYLVIYVAAANTGKSFTLDGGTSLTDLGWSAKRADAVRWNPAVTDAEFAPQAAESYNMKYESPKLSTDFAPQQFFSLSQVVSAYGDVSAANTLSLGAQAAFGNGASIVTCRQIDPAKTGTALNMNGELKAALNDLEDWDVSVLVPMVALNAEISATPVAMDSEYLDHVSKMSSSLERKERMCILGMDERGGRLTISGGTGTWQGYLGGLKPALSSGLAPKRVMVVNPGRCLTSSKGVAIEADGTYAAACLAGRMVSSEFDQAEPMTRKTLATVDELILPELSRPEKNLLTSLGATVVEAKSSLITVRRAITVDSSSIASQEPSIVRSFDLVAASLREALENRFVGTKIVNTTSTALEAATSRFLDSFVDSEIISTYRNVKAEQNKLEPRQFDISFEAVPVYPFLWGFIDISITLS